MRVRLARTAGFCMGVRRAMELALISAHRSRDGETCTFGPLIHNPQVLELLEKKGVGCLAELPAAGSRTGGTVIIRAHGVPPAEREALKAAGFAAVVDGTCPRVVKVQAIVRRAAKAGADPVIVGDADHPEVRGLLGHALGRGHVASRAAEVAALPALGRVVAVAQTTQSEALFAEVVAALKARFGQVEVHDTICEATRRRQDEVLRLAAEVDGVVVVGGRASGNTKRLAELAGREGKPIFLVESEEELDPARLRGLGLVGVTAGASTPNWMIKRVVRAVAAIRAEGEGRLGFLGRRVFRFLVRSQLWVAVGGAGMTVAAGLLQGIAPSPPLAATAALYLYSMHILNHFLDKEAGQYNDPDRAAFLAKHQRFLIGSGVTAALAALGLALGLGLWPFLLVALMSVMGLLYSLPVLPRGLFGRLNIDSLKDIPGSKTLSASLAWAAIAAGLPALARGVPAPGGLLVGLIFVGGLLFARCALLDILDVQGDLVVGKETIPIVLGEAPTQRLLAALLGGVILLLGLAPLGGLTPRLAWLLVPVPLGVALMQRLLGRGLVPPGAVGEGLTDLSFWLAGALALAWHLA